MKLMIKINHYSGITTSDPSVSQRADRIKPALRRNIEWFNAHLPKSSYASAISCPFNADNCPVRVYNLQGMMIGTFNSKDEAVSNLKSGIYIMNGKKIKIQ